MLRRVGLAVLVLATISGLAVAQSLEKGFESLVERNYEKAFNAFTKQLPKRPFPSNYGFGRLFFQQDSLNKWFNLDSANVYTSRADATMGLEKPDDLVKLAKLDVTPDKVPMLKKLIVDASFEAAKKQNSVAGFQHLIDT